MQIPDDPYIKFAEQTGYAPWQNVKQPRCPVCGNECEIVYKDSSNEIVGCDECLTGCDATDEEACFPEWEDE